MSVPPLTYQQILSQQYEESARNLLVFQQEPLTTDSNIDAHISDEPGMTLQNPEDFQQFGGDRGTEENIIVSKPFVDNGKGSVRYNKDVQVDIFSIDSRFRSYAAAGIPEPTTTLNTYANNFALAQTVSASTLTSLSSNFVFRVQKLTRNVFSSKLTSFQLPNTFYNILDSRYNNYFYIAMKSCSEAQTYEYEKIKVLTIDTSAKAGRCSNYTQGSSLTPNGFYYTNTTITNAINTALQTTRFPDPVIKTITNYEDTIVVEVTSTAALNTNDYITISNTNDDYNTSGVYVIDQIIDSTHFRVIWGSFGLDPFEYFDSSDLPLPTVSVSTPVYFSRDLSASYSNGYFQIDNKSQNTYTIDFTPLTSSVSTTLFSTLGRLLGFNNYSYDIHPHGTKTLSSASFDCGQISACQCYGSLVGEDMIDMNTDPYIYLSIADWANIEHAIVNDTFFTAFARIPITVPKGEMIYDNLINNTVTKIYYFKQPANIQQFEIKLLDMTGSLLIMPNTNWSMVLEMEEVLSQSLYEKLREL